MYIGQTNIEIYIEKLYKYYNKISFSNLSIKRFMNNHAKCEIDRIFLPCLN